MSAYDPKRTLAPLGGFEGGVLAVLADEHVGGAVDVEVADHECRTSNTTNNTAMSLLTSITNTSVNYKC